MTLYVFLIEGSGVIKSDLIGKSDPYCVLSISGEPDKQQSKHIDDCHEPKWNDSFTFFVKDTSKSLHIEMMDKDIPPKKDDTLATLDIPISSLPVNKEIEKWYSMTPTKGRQGSTKIHLQISYSK
ncbi:Protein Aster-C [Tritrichomonas musculus]|uniref:Protein Aster-C n=1 Tax=Tritrichomonas musculus TaxID=1915356 RepID=A0ABR2KYL5_9EUKA